MLYIAMNVRSSNSPYALVVDDDMLIRMYAKGILEDFGFRVFEAEDGDAALALLETRHPEIALLFTDVQMPGQLDGFALARTVATLWPHISIVVASGHIVPSSTCMPETARFVGKPFSAKVVYAHLQEIFPDGEKPERLEH